MMKMKSRTYSELMTFKTFEERYNYLKIGGTVGMQTFGINRFLNQEFYRTKQWRSVRDKIIIRDAGCELGLENFEINDTLYIHHLNPITENDIINNDFSLYDPENLITVSYNTHEAIHYAKDNFFILQNRQRKKNDTNPWRE